MSTILDALRKVQRDRAAENPSRDLRGSITTETPVVVPEKRRGSRLWIALILLLVAVAVAGGGYWRYRSRATVEASSVPSADEPEATVEELDAAVSELAAAVESREPAPPEPARAQSGAEALQPAAVVPPPPVPDSPQIAAERARLEAALANARAAQEEQALVEAEAARQAAQASQAAAAVPPAPAEQAPPAPAAVEKAESRVPRAAAKPAVARKPAAAKPVAPAPAASSGDFAQPSSVFPTVRVESIRWHPIPERRVASLHFEQQDAPEAREGDIVSGVLVYRIDPGAVELRIGSAQRVVSPEP